MIYRNYFKPLMDFCLALVALTAISPIFASICIGLILQNNGRIFFLQERIGYFQKPFKIIKFKTMNDKKDSAGNLLDENLRLSSLGRFLRAWSLDELPQLINVCRGEMSLIGPRPLLFRDLPFYSIEQLKRFEVKPGITGWAQVNGRNSTTWTKRFELDLFYCENYSWKLDFSILLLTLKKVIIREGINQNISRGMEPFNGKN